MLGAAAGREKLKGVMVLPASLLVTGGVKEGSDPREASCHGFEAFHKPLSTRRLL